MKAETFDRFCAFLEQHSGILLSRDKQYLVETRLSRVARSKGYSTVESLIETLLSRRDRMLARDVVDAMTTNETLWFRDGYPFAALEKKFFPEAVAAKKATYRVWSAACSTGQEAFSISIIAEEQRVPFNLEIVGTDISEAVVEKARRGVFDDLSLGRGLSPERKRQFFVKATDGWKVAPQISRRTQFRVGNLLELRPEARRYDLVFCRNVLIYFSRDTKAKIIDRIADTLVPGGYLILGASESLTQLSDRFTPERLPTGGTAYRLKS
ncbi:methyltransferase domain-containing protein [Guyparkeria halophila]|uniref:protein-glutamate O-methyltransferase n=1 Tax=Guyparkeria halophila TaxID=47960 RepID=A0A6I6CZD9_9GAMM|nr:MULTISPECIES: protein-glutamate O-methyltransferase CheR [Guyparkeria]QGT78008.1 methyltransferase domain-containing protein [Guyparkeria halophila]TKA90518.1 protein-glutamate O-methyltransferase CheR [Guyparkeria sp. SB14A]